MNLLLLLSKIKHSPKMAKIRQFTNLLYYDPNFVNIDVRKFDVIEIDGFKFKVTDQINAIQSVKGNTWFDGVWPTDTVVDIGANIGAMTIPLAKQAKAVYAVEPLFHEELFENVCLNNLDNIKIFNFGIGKGNLKDIAFSSKSGTVPMVSFKEFRDMVGGDIDYLKMDGEGCEWDIEPSELKGIRELRIEFHISRKNEKECRKKYAEYLDWMKGEGYKITIKDIDIGPNPYFIDDPEVEASLI